MNIKFLLQKFFARRGAYRLDEVPAYRFSGRLTTDDLLRHVRAALGRPLRLSERDAVLDGFRPQGLLGPDDHYVIRVASPRYLGKDAPEVEIFATLVAGYADGEPTLNLTETAALCFRDEYGDDRYELMTAPFAA